MPRAIHTFGLLLQMSSTLVPLLSGRAPTLESAKILSELNFQPCRCSDSTVVASPCDTVHYIMSELFLQKVKGWHYNPRPPVLGTATATCWHSGSFLKNSSF
ncbi:unnamed protein product [Amoebophrya sp. A120]|nr:unnamed protein product [Amoebophrya sp. A120]|eukprot:GSA120T00008649001.1